MSSISRRDLYKSLCSQVFINLYNVIFLTFNILRGLFFSSIKISIIWSTCKSNKPCRWHHWFKEVQKMAYFLGSSSELVGDLKYSKSYCFFPLSIFGVLCLKISYLLRNVILYFLFLSFLFFPLVSLTCEDCFSLTIGSTNRRDNKNLI